VEAVSFSNKKAWLRYGAVAAIGVLLAVGAAAGWHFAVEPQLAKKSAQEQLQQAQDARGTLRLANTTLSSFAPAELIEGTNPDQKALISGDLGREAGVFIFGNGASQASAQVMDVYLDFSSQRSRDFFLQNQTVLQSAIQAGAVELRIHPVPNSSSPFSLYAPEALAEAAVLQPDFAWPLLIDLLKLSTELSTTPTDDVAQAVASRAERAGVRGIDRASITNGTFASWLLAVGEDSKVRSPYGLPAIYRGGELLDSSTVDINNPNVFREYLTR
jgi:hypothetical protein